MTKKKEYSGKFVLRMDPKKHKELAETAFGQGDSLNSFVLNRIFGVQKKVEKKSKKSLAV